MPYYFITDSLLPQSLKGLTEENTRLTNFTGPYAVLTACVITHCFPATS